MQLNRASTIVFATAVAITGRCASSAAASTLPQRQQAGAHVLADVRNVPRVELGNIGAVELAPGAGKFFHQVASATRLDNGVIIVANRGSNELLFFDSLGKALSVAGRKGSGPGEFNAISSVIKMNGDTAAVLDLQHRRISLLTPRGFITDYPLRAPEAATSPPSLGEAFSGLPERQLLVWLQTLPKSEADIRRWNEPNTVSQVPLIVFTVDAAGNTRHVIGEFPGDEKYLGKVGSTPVNLGPAPFGDLTRFGVAAGKVFVFRSAERSIRVYGVRGELREVYRLAWPARKVTAKDRREYVAVRVARQPRFRDNFERMPFPAQMPAFRSALIGTDEIMWLEPYHLWAAGRRLFVGYDSRGNVIGQLLMSESDRVLHIGRGRAIVLSVDSLGVERVRVGDFRFSGTQ